MQITKALLALSSPILGATSAVPGLDGSINPCRDLKEQPEIDKCYMRLALDHVLIHNPTFPFGALIVDHTKNEISCYGANSNRRNKLLHGKSEGDKIRVYLY